MPIQSGFASCLVRNIIQFHKCAFANLSDRLYRISTEKPGNYCLNATTDINPFGSPPDRHPFDFAESVASRANSGINPCAIPHRSSRNECPHVEHPAPADRAAQTSPRWQSHARGNHPLSRGAWPSGCPTESEGSQSVDAALLRTDGDRFHARTGDQCNSLSVCITSAIPVPLLPDHPACRTDAWFAP